MVDRSHDLPWFKFFASDWMSDVEIELMPLEAQGAFVRMLCFQWINGPLPDDPDLVARLCDIPRGRMDEIWSEVRPQFERTEGENLYDPDLETMRENIADTKESRSQAGKKGAASTHDYESVDEMEKLKDADEALTPA